MSAPYPWTVYPEPARSERFSHQQIQATAAGPCLPARRLSEQAFEVVFARPVLVTFTKKDRR